MITVYQGNCLDILPTLASDSVQCCITSPPFWGLRDYGHPDQLGMEPTADEYVANLVRVFREVKRVLRHDSVLWLNLGDCYVDKQLQGIPWKVAFALQADGWVLRSDVIWSKSNCMPSSVTDRPTCSHEYLFMFSKNKHYYYDATAIAEPAIKTDMRETTFKRNGTKRNEIIIPGHADVPHREDRPDTYPTGTRNKRSVWTIPTRPFSGAHFATFPEALITPCILAGSSPQACEGCGSPWERVVEHTNAESHRKPGSTFQSRTDPRFARGGAFTGAETITTGWAPTCNCPTLGTARTIVLDPFAGSGTTGTVATRYGRDAILIELNPAYIPLIEDRNNGVQTSMEAFV